MRRSARKDVVHAPIVRGLLQHGVVVFEMPQPGDVLCYYIDRLSGEITWMPMEFKSPADVQHKKGVRKKTVLPGSELTRAQKQRAAIATIPIVHSLAEALALFGLMESS